MKLKLLKMANGGKRGVFVHPPAHKWAIGETVEVSEDIGFELLGKHKGMFEQVSGGKAKTGRPKSDKGMGLDEYRNK